VILGRPRILSPISHPSRSEMSLHYHPSWTLCKPLPQAPTVLCRFVLSAHQASFRLECLGGYDSSFPRPSDSEGTSGSYLDEPAVVATRHCVLHLRDWPALCRLVVSEVFYPSPSSPRCVVVFWGVPGWGQVMIPRTFPVSSSLGTGGGSELGFA
jgi:hypothetical protein